MTVKKCVSQRKYLPNLTLELIITTSILKTRGSELNKIEALDDPENEIAATDEAKMLLALKTAFFSTEHSSGSQHLLEPNPGLLQENRLA